MVIRALGFMDGWKKTSSDLPAREVMKIVESGGA